MPKFTNYSTLQDNLNELPIEQRVNDVKVSVITLTLTSTYLLTSFIDTCTVLHWNIFESRPLLSPFCSSCVMNIHQHIRPMQFCCQETGLLEYAPNCNSQHGPITELFLPRTENAFSTEPMYKSYILVMCVGRHFICSVEVDVNK